MKYWRIWTLSFLTILVAACSGDSDTTPAAVNTFDRGAMLVNWADNIIVPSYVSFSSKTSTLKISASNFASAPTAESLHTLRNDWKAAYIEFQKVSMFEIGKAQEIRFRQHLNVYPASENKIEANISASNFNFSDAASFDAQGFPAVDYMINGLGSTDAEILSFYTTNNQSAKYRAYILKLTESISALTDQVLADWNNGFRDSFVSNSGSSATGAVDKLTNDYIFYFEKFLRAGKVGIPAGVFSGNTLPSNVEAFYKKDLSKILLLQSLRSTQDFFNGKSAVNGATGPSFKSYLEYLNTIKNGVALSTQINTQFENVRTVVEGLNENFTTQISTDNSKMLMAFDELQRIVIFLKVDMVQAMNISIDYVDSDGD